MMEKPIGTCEACQATDVPVQVVERRDPDAIREGEVAWPLCDLCYSTLTGTWSDYNINELVPVLQTICYVGNSILKAIHAQNPPSRPR